MKLLASKFNEKKQELLEKVFSQISAVRTGVRAYMDATPLHYIVENCSDQAWKLQTR